jgi:replicative DNA helicase
VELIIEKLKKIKELSERGINGEAKAAKAVEKLLAKYNLTVESLSSETKIKCCFKARKDNEHAVLFMCVLKISGQEGKKVYEPQLHDLRESGDIEQDADIVLFVHRPTYYDRDKYAEWEGRGKIIIGKYREGEHNRSVVFCHDANFKKIWGDENFAKRLSGNSLQDYHSGPEAKMLF